MSTAISELVTQAYREGNLIGVGASPTAAEQTEGLARFNTTMRSLWGYELGAKLLDWLVPAPQRVGTEAANFPQLPYPTDLVSAWPSAFAQDPLYYVYQYPPQNSRIVFGSNQNQVAYFPEQPDDGARMGIVQGSAALDGGYGTATITLNGNSRTIEGEDTLELTAPVTAQEWMYRADLADWVSITDLTLTDDCPFPEEFDDLWITLLSARLAPRYGKTIAPSTMQTIATGMQRLKARYRQSGVTVFGSQDFPRTLQGYISGRWNY